MILVHSLQKLYLYIPPSFCTRATPYEGVGSSHTACVTCFEQLKWILELWALATRGLVTLASSVLEFSPHGRDQVRTRSFSLPGGEQAIAWRSSKAWIFEWRFLAPSNPAQLTAEFGRVLQPVPPGSESCRQALPIFALSHFILGSEFWNTKQLKCKCIDKCIPCTDG